MPPPDDRDHGDAGNDDAGGFSDSDQAWWDRVRGVDAERPPAGDAEREGEALRRARAMERQALGLEAGPDPAAAAERWQRARARLQREGQLEHPRPPQREDLGAGRGAWRVPARNRAGWAAALAATLAAVVVFVQWPAEEPPLYDEPPALRSSDVEELRLAVAAPRTDAEALAATLRAAGWKAALYQRRGEFFIDTSVDADLPPAAREALAALGVRTTTGSVRLQFVPK
ncbi:MAG: hypothetical protein QM750_12450 [Rubrivivax sp.]